MKKILLPILLMILVGALLVPAALSASEQVKTDSELVSLSETTHINDAIQVLETFSWKYDKKKLINLSSYNASIGVPINFLTWRKALELIVLKNNLMLVDQAGYVAVADPSVPQKVIKEEAPTVNVNSKQVRIKAIIMLADRAYLQALGIDWTTISNGSVLANIGLTGATQIPGDIFNATLNRTTTFGGNPIEINALIRTIESDQKGYIIAQPNIIVSSGKRGFIQVGQDISIKSTDEAGNTTDKFFATGVIMDVVPTIIMAENKPMIHLKAEVERSAAAPGAVSTIINKSKSTTEVILFDGEETVIGGLFDSDDVVIRSGIPILKDLPWWVFGIRYLTGYDRKEKKEREMIIIMKVEVINSAIERMNQYIQEQNSN